MLNRNGYSEHPWIVYNLGETALYLSALSMMLTYRFLNMPLVILRKIPYVPMVLRVFLSLLEVVSFFNASASIKLVIWLCKKFWYSELYQLIFECWTNITVLRQTIPIFFFIFLCSIFEYFTECLYINIYKVYCPTAFFSSNFWLVFGMQVIVIS